MRVLVVTGTGTDIGKTVVTAALAACAMRAGQRVAVVKPIQTGVQPGEPGDLAEVRRLTGIEDLHEFARFDEPLAPATAAERAGRPAPSVAELAERIVALGDRDLVLVEGAGGAAVRFNAAGETIIDLAAALARTVQLDTIQLETVQLENVLVASSGLGTLNSAALTSLAFAARSLPLAHVIIGAWPRQPDLAERCNLSDLPRYAGAPLSGVIPAGAGALGCQNFAERAVGWLTSGLGGNLDAPHFVSEHAAALPPQKGDQ
jgi:dethiobiotin synthetase